MIAERAWQCQQLGDGSWRCTRLTSRFYVAWGQICDLLLPGLVSVWCWMLQRLFELLERHVGRNGAECDETRFTHLDNCVM